MDQRAGRAPHSITLHGGDFDRSRVTPNGGPAELLVVSVEGGSSHTYARDRRLSKFEYACLDGDSSIYTSIKGLLLGTAETGSACQEIDEIVKNVPMSLWHVLTMITPDRAGYVTTWGQESHVALDHLARLSADPDLPFPFLDVLFFFHLLIEPLQEFSGSYLGELFPDAGEDSDPQNQRAAAVLASSRELREFLAHEYQIPTSEISWHRLGTTSFIVRYNATMENNTGKVIGSRVAKCVFPFYASDQRVAESTSGYLANFARISETVGPTISHSGRRSILMTYISGDTLQEKLDRGPQRRYNDLNDLGRYGPTLISNVAELHRTGIFHFDLSLSNIILWTDPSEGAAQIRLIDFGINYAAFGTIQGARAPLSIFVAPELRLGLTTEDDKAGYLADAYSLGVILANLPGGMLGTREITDGMFSEHPVLCWLLMDLIDAHREDRLGILCTSEPYDADKLHSASKAIRQAVPDMGADKDAHAKARASDLSQLSTAAKNAYRIFSGPWQLRRQQKMLEDIEAVTSNTGFNQIKSDLDGTYVNRWSTFSTILCALAALWLATYTLVPLGGNILDPATGTLAGQHPNLWSRIIDFFDPIWIAPYPIDDKQTFWPRLAGFSMTLVVWQYYQTVFASFSSKRLGLTRGERFSLEVALRSIPTFTPVVVVILLALDAHYWIYAIVICSSAITLSNAVIYERLKQLAARTSEPRENAERITDYASWRNAMTIYVAILAMVAFVVHTDYKNLYIIAAIFLMAVNVFIHYFQKCTIEGPRLRGVFTRVVFGARRQTLLAQYRAEAEKDALELSVSVP